MTKLTSLPDNQNIVADAAQGLTDIVYAVGDALEDGFETASSNADVLKRELAGHTASSSGDFDPNDDDDDTSNIDLQNDRGVNSVEDLFDKPELLNEKTPSDIRNVIDNSTSSGNWVEGTLGKGSHAGQGFTLREVNARGNYTGRMIQWHPGGGHHGIDPYWKVSSPQDGTVRIGPQFPLP